VTCKLTTQLVLGRAPLHVDRTRRSNIATLLLGRGGARSVFGATEGIPDDGHGDVGRL
jgi:hypothetical protein